MEGVADTDGLDLGPDLSDAVAFRIDCTAQPPAVVAVGAESAVAVAAPAED